MKTKFYTVIAVISAGILCGCVNVDKEVAASPTVYWKAPKEAIPSAVVQPEQIKTNEIESPESASKSSDAKKEELPLSASERLMLGQELDLSELVDIALENNTQTRVYWFQAKSFAAAQGKAESAYYPQVSVGGQIYRAKIHQSAGYPGALPIGSYYETGYGPSAQINWLLYDFGKREAQVNSAREALRAANFDYNQSIQDVVLSVNLAYYSMFRAAASVKAAEMDIEDSRTAYESVTMKLEQGVGVKQDVLNALANYRNAEFALTTAQGDVERARASLATAMGIRVSSNLKVSYDVKLPDTTIASEKIDELISKAMHARQNVLASYARLAQAKSNVEIARRDFLPEISATGAASYLSYTRSERDDQYQYQGGLTASWSIFEGFARKYELLSAKAAERARAQSLKADEIKVISDVWAYYHVYQSAVKQVESSLAAVEANTEALNATRIGYENGVSNINDYLNSQFRLAEARQQNVSARANLCVAIAQLAHATGTFTATIAPQDMPEIPQKAASTESK